MASNPLSITSTVKLSSGHAMPTVGLGVALNSDAKDTVPIALAAGYRLIDCAQRYGNEAEVGEGVRASGVPRSDVFVTSKIMSTNAGYESTMTGVEASLKAFGFDYLDLFLIHDPKCGSELRLATYRALIELRDKGKLKSIGVSNYGVHHLEEIQKAGLELPAVNQVETHPFCQQRPIVAWCREHGIAVQAFCPLVRGRMDDPVIVSIAKKHNRDPAQILVRWSLQHGLVPLPKSSHAARIKSNINVYDFELDKEDMDALDSLDQGAQGAVSWNPVDSP
ncbi:Aldo/keto reductase [Dentipellis sp. KUC8613]|nr:Aldo/keto reductase [Dentipellis sp. KUC8613]